MTKSQQDGTAANQSRLDLLDRSLKYCTEEYDLASDTFSTLDGKAQALFGVSGLFIAGVVGLSNASAAPGRWVVWGAAACYALLVGVIVASLVALKVRDVAVPMDAAAVVSMTLDVINLPDAELTPEVRANWYRDQLNEWLRVVNEIENVNARKARWVTSAQVMLIAAVITAGVVTFGVGFSE